MDTRETEARHGCGLCNASADHLIFDADSAPGDEWWVCDKCGWEHMSRDCCERA